MRSIDTSPSTPQVPSTLMQIGHGGGHGGANGGWHGGGMGGSSWLQAILAGRGWPDATCVRPSTSFSSSRHGSSTPCARASRANRASHGLLVLSAVPKECYPSHCNPLLSAGPLLSPFLTHILANIPGTVQLCPAPPGFPHMACILLRCAWASNRWPLASLPHRRTVCVLHPCLWVSHAASGFRRSQPAPQILMQPCPGCCESPARLYSQAAEEPASH